MRYNTMNTEYNENCNEKHPKFKCDRVRISKYKNIFAKGYTQNWPEDFFVVIKIKNTVLIKNTLAIYMVNHGSFL